MNSSAICTLYEGNYHYGVAALINSLHRQQFNGDVYVGYRGDLPKWVDGFTPDKGLSWLESVSFRITEKMQIHFLPVTTDYHLTNYKPDFMLILWERVANSVKKLFYFDPDIVLLAPWTYFINWADCGIALCEDENSPLTEFHPRRVAWRHYFGKKGFKLNYSHTIYANGGFIGVKDKAFLYQWQQIQEAMAPQIGGLSRSSLMGKPLLVTDQGALSPFGKTDQDALNATIESWNGPVSFHGKDAMAFTNGTILMAHALGSTKPWKNKYLIQALKGNSPRLADRAYWSCVNDVIRSQPKTLVLRKKMEIFIAVFMGRFYRRRSI